MYFSSLNKIQDEDSNLIIQMDKYLKNKHSYSGYITPKNMAIHLNINEDKSYDLLFKAMELNVIGTIEIKKCNTCNQVMRKSHNVCKTKDCNSTNFTEGIYFTTDLHKNQ